jgi:hypothetical protein
VNSTWLECSRTTADGTSAAARTRYIGIEEYEHHRLAVPRAESRNLTLTSVRRVGDDAGLDLHPLRRAVGDRDRNEHVPALLRIGIKLATHRIRHQPLRELKQFAARLAPLRQAIAPRSR